jgi:hypothetical protein
MNPDHPAFCKHIVRVHTVTHETDWFSILRDLPDLYESIDGDDGLQAGVDSLQLLNNHLMPHITIPVGAQVRYLVDNKYLHRLDGHDTRRVADLHTVVSEIYPLLETTSRYVWSSSR